MRATWDAAAASDRVDEYVGDPATARAELEGLFGRLGADPRGGTCVEVGCGPGRMTARARRAVRPRRRRRRLRRDARARPRGRDGAERRLPARGRRPARLGRGRDRRHAGLLPRAPAPARAAASCCATCVEFGRVLAPAGSAFVQLPVLRDGVRPRLWRLARAVAVPVSGLFRRGRDRPGRLPGHAAHAKRELQAGLAAAGLRMAARDESPESPYRYAREVFLRLERTE